MAQRVRETDPGTPGGEGGPPAGYGVVGAGGVPARLRAARLGYALVATAFAACVAVQVFLAGMGVFGGGDGFGWHTSFVYTFEAMPLVPLPLAFLGRLRGATRWLPLALIALLAVQYATANSTAVNVAALHPVNALAIFWIATVLARRGWGAAAAREVAA